MRHHILALLAIVILISGCTSGPPAGEASVSLLEGASLYQGELPELQPVQFTSVEGAQVKLEGAYPGLVMILAQPLAEISTIELSFTAAGGEVEASIPKAGIYLVSVPEGDESVFLSAMYNQPWFMYGSPATPLEIAVVVPFDYYSNSATPTNCGDDHGDLTSTIARKYGSTVVGVDMEKDLARNTGVDMQAKMLEIMESAGNFKGKAVLSFSLQSHASYLGVSDEELRTGCHTIRCQTVRDEQKIFFAKLLHVMEAEAILNPAAADRSMLIVSAGNAGVDLSIELGELRDKYPNAFSRVKIVGASDQRGQISQSMNRVDGTQPDEMVYARGENTPITIPGLGTVSCDGTSFSAPEIAALMDYIWSFNSDLTSDQVMDIFDKALAELGRNHVIPQDADGMATQEFLDRLQELATVQQTQGGETGGGGQVQPIQTVTLTITRTPSETGMYAGFQVNPGPLSSDLDSCTEVCHTEYAQGSVVDLSIIDQDGAIFTGWSGACSGTGNCRVVMDSDKSATAGFDDDMVTLTVIRSGDYVGTFTVDPYGWKEWGDCLYECSTTYIRGTQVTLDDSPVEGITFEGWSGPCSGTGSCTVTMNGDRTVEARYKLKQAPITGTWTGSYSDVGSDANGCTFYSSGDLSMTVQGTGDSFSGSNMINGLEIRRVPGCTYMGTSTGDGSVSGTVSGNQISGTFWFTNHYYYTGNTFGRVFTGTIEGNTMTGTWESTNEIAGTGSFTLTKQ